ncbi:MAG: site-specific integrase, partial [Methanobrevibacter sp.]|nr:site-specific integrase [Methanobrevibacter sp.]
MAMNNEEISSEISLMKNHSKQTQKIYKRVIEYYSEYNQMSMYELIEEADREEEQGIRWKKRKIKHRLLRFRQHLVDENYTKATIKQYFTVVKAVYRHYEIEIHNIPTLNERNVNIPEDMEFEDLLSHEELNIVLENVNAKFRAIILFMTSSGCARNETLSLTINDYIKATEDYHKKTDIYEVIEELNKIDDVIPKFKLKRQKTNKYYFTFCSPEAVKAINNYLLNHRLNLKPSDKLFKIKPSYLPYALNQLNEGLGFGHAGSYGRLRTHMFRKFHASMLLKGGMTESEIDNLQGRGKSQTHTAYFYDDTEDLREKYISCLGLLAIKDNVNNYDIKSQEY